MINDTFLQLKCGDSLKLQLLFENNEAEFIFSRLDWELFPLDYFYIFIDEGCILGSLGNLRCVMYCSNYNNSLYFFLNARMCF